MIEWIVGIVVVEVIASMVLIEAWQAWAEMPVLRSTTRRMNGKTNPEPHAPSGIEPEIGQFKPQVEPGERTEADPYQGQGQGRSVEPGGKEEERERGEKGG